MNLLWKIHFDFCFYRAGWKDPTSQSAEQKKENNGLVKGRMEDFGRDGHENCPMEQPVFRSSCMPHTRRLRVTIKQSEGKRLPYK